MNRIDLKNKARENVAKDKFAIILVTLIATAILGAGAGSVITLPGLNLHWDFLQIQKAPNTSAVTPATAPTAKDEFDVNDFFDEDGEFDLDHYYGFDDDADEKDPFSFFGEDFGFGDREDAGTTQVSIGNGALSLVVFLLAGALTAGLLSYHLKIWRGQTGELKDIFSKFNKDFPRITKMYLLQTLYIALWTLLLIVPGIVAAISYSQAYYLMLDDPDLGAIDALNQSRELMKGRKGDYFLLWLSFCGWLLLSVLTFGILYLWVRPYMLQTFAGYYEEVIRPAKAELEWRTP